MLMNPPPGYSPSPVNRQTITPLGSPGSQGAQVTGTRPMGGFSPTLPGSNPMNLGAATQMGAGGRMPSGPGSPGMGMGLGAANQMGMGSGQGMNPMMSKLLMGNG